MGCYEIEPNHVILVLRQPRITEYEYEYANEKKSL